MTTKETKGMEVKWEKTGLQKNSREWMGTDFGCGTLEMYEEALS
jgi:hypothetical protein